MYIGFVNRNLPAAAKSNLAAMKALPRDFSRAKLWAASHRQQIAYGMGGFASSVIDTLFKLFNVALFTSVVKLEPSSFYAGHIIYALWNAVNDPAFGYLLDRMGGARLAVIKYGGPLWCAFFMVTWFPWSYDGSSWLAFCHFLVSMFCFDGFLTLVLMVKCALLADLCIDSRERNQLNNFSAWFALAGSSLAMTSYYTWDVNNLVAFRLLATVLCAISAAAWYFSGAYMVMPETKTKQNEADSLLMHDDEAGLANNASEDVISADSVSHKAQNNIAQASSLGSLWQELASWWSFARQLLAQKYFLLYVLLNWMMNFNVYLSDSFLVFLDQILMRKVMPVWFRIFVSSLCLYLPRFGIQILTPLADRMGLHAMISMVIKLSLATGIAALLIGRSAWWLWGILLVLQRFALSSWGFYDLIMADVIDADRVKHQRPSSVSTSIHGVQSLIVKPAQSVAPMIGVWLLTRNGLVEGHHGKLVSLENHTLAKMGNSTGGKITADASVALQSTVFYLTFGVPLICTVAQLFLWKRFDLRDDKLRKVKEALRNM